MCYLSFNTTLPNLTYLRTIEKFASLGTASIAIDMLRLDVRTVLRGPLLSNGSPLCIVIGLSGKISLAFGTIQSATSNHFHFFFLLHFLAPNAELSGTPDLEENGELMGVRQRVSAASQGCRL